MCDASKNQQKRSARLRRSFSAFHLEPPSFFVTYPSKESQSFPASRNGGAMSRPPMECSTMGDGVWNRPTPRRNEQSSWNSGRIRVTLHSLDRVESLLILAL